MGDLLIVLSLLCLVLAVIWPSVRRATYQARVDKAASDIEAMEVSARSHLERRGSWPAESPSGSIPEELVGSLPADFAPETAHYSVDWNLWERVGPLPESDPGGEADPEAGAPTEPEGGAPEMAATTQPLPGITIRSDDDGLLAGLLQRYGQDASFVSGRSWTLILRDAGSGTG